MKESFWSVMIVIIGVISVAFIYFFQTVTFFNEQNYTIIKEVTEAAMWDAVDWAEYRATGNVRINREKFVENFLRRFSESVSLGNSYQIDIYDVNEIPPKVSLKVSSKLNSNVTSETKEIILVEGDIITTSDNMQYTFLY